VPPIETANRPADEGAGAVRASVGLHRPARGITLLEGPDAERFLQGMVSNDVAATAIGDATYALLLTPKARVIADLHALRVGPNAYLLLSAPEAAETIRRTLLRYRLRSQVTITDAAAGDAALLVAGAKAGMLLLDRCGVLPRTDAPEGAGAEIPTAHGTVHAVASVACGDKAFELVGPTAAIDELEARLADGLAKYGGGRFDAAALESLRVEAGVPRYGAEIDEQVFPAEAGLVERAVSFTKGCYTGQEPVARLHYRGHANRGLRTLRLDGPPPPRDAAVVVDGREVGRVTSAVHGPATGAVVALAIVRREVDPGQGVEVRWDGGEATGVLVSGPAYSWPTRPA